jgi:hypothetical protein
MMEITAGRVGQFVRNDISAEIRAFFFKFRNSLLNIHQRISQFEEVSRAENLKQFFLSH